MNINNGQGVANVTISERNLRDLLRAYEAGQVASIRRVCEDGTALYLTVEPDDIHYRNGRVPGPGIAADRNVGIGPSAPHSRPLNHEARRRQLLLADRNNADNKGAL
jgi:hypothetical protein